MVVLQKNRNRIKIVE